MGILIEVDFLARRRVGPDPGDVVVIAKGIRRSIKKAELRPKIKVSVRTIRAPVWRGTDRITVTVKAAECQVYRRAWLDWMVDSKTKHRPRPPEAELPRYTDQMAALLRTIRAIIQLHPGDYLADLMVDPAIGIAELHEHERARLSAGVTS